MSECLGPPGGAAGLGAAPEVSAASQDPEGRDPQNNLCHLTVGGVAPEPAILEGCLEELQLP